jgi:alkanesulfonate monooxygenase SsuD/methylene tetrahydromethanopterin reductase-like flavin-dependent oxidoreductase (luciferase family)
MMWGAGTPAFDGPALGRRDTICYPRPISEHVPILVGGGGERRTLRLVAQYADACNVMGEPETVRHKVAVLRSHCEEVGRDVADVEVTHLSPLLVGADRDEVARLVEAGRGSSQSAAGYAERMLAGTTDDHIGRFRQLADAGVSTAIVSLAGMDDAAGVERFAPVVAAFAD